MWWTEGATEEHRGISLQMAIWFGDLKSATTSQLCVNLKPPHGLYSYWRMGSKSSLGMAK